MPYATNADLPAAVRGALPAGAQTIWRGAYTGFSKSNPKAKEEAGFKVAWAAVKNKFRKEGDKWIEIEDAKAYERDRSMFLYMEPRPNTADHAQCGTCANFNDKTGRCRWLAKDFDVDDDDTCGLYAQGKPSSAVVPTGQYKPEEIGYYDGLVQCQRCIAFKDGDTCEWFEKINKAFDLDLNTTVKARGCCNAWAPATGAKQMKTKDAVTFWDRAAVQGMRKTKDGYLAAYAKIARAGVQTYKGKELGRPDLGEVSVYRPPEEVFSRDAMTSLSHRPLTFAHPSEMVDASNWKKHAIGHTGDEVVRDGDFVRVPMLVMDAAAISRIQDDKEPTRELSVGYTADLEWKKGKTDDGENYDAIQHDIRGNHLAIVSTARAGAGCRIGDDKDEHGHGSNPRGEASGLAAHTEATETAQKKFPVGSKVRENRQGAETHVVVGHNGNMLHLSSREGQPRDDMHVSKVVKVKDADEQVCPKCAMEVPASATVCPYCQEELDDDMETYGDSDNSVGPDSEYDVEADRHLKVLSSLKTTPQAKRKARTDLMNYLTENYGDTEGMRRYDELVTGLKDGAMFYDRDFTTKQRKAAAKSGAAMPGGGFPIENRSDLENAVSAFGRAKNPKAAKAHIIKRARALGATGDLPDNWKVKDAAAGGNTGEKAMTAIVIVDGARIEVADELSASVINKHIQKLHGHAADLQGKLDKSEASKEEAEEESEREQKDSKAKMDAKDGEIAALKKQLADSQALNTPTKLDELVRARNGVIDAARPLLDSKFSFDGKSNEDIRREAVLGQLGGDAVKLMSDAAIEGAFAMLSVKAKNNGVRKLADSITMHNQRSNGERGSFNDDREAAMAEREKFLNNAWRGDQK